MVLKKHDNIIPLEQQSFHHCSPTDNVRKLEQYSRPVLQQKQRYCVLTKTKTPLTNASSLS